MEIDTEWRFANNFGVISPNTRTNRVVTKVAIAAAESILIFGKARTKIVTAVAEAAILTRLFHTAMVISILSGSFSQKIRRFPEGGPCFIILRIWVGVKLTRAISELEKRPERKMKKIRIIMWIIISSN